MRLLWVFCCAAAILALEPAPAIAQAQTPLVENQAAYLARCHRETLAQYPNARAQVDSICNSNWEQIIAAGPIADAILAVAPATGGAFDAAGAQGRIGALRGLQLTVNRAPTPGITISWSRAGVPIPFNLEGALHARGATLAIIGCEWFGYSENTRVYRVDAQGKAPFALTISLLNAEVGNQSSSYMATAAYGGRLPTLATLNRGGSEYQATCPG